ncbi:MAG: hypothetical protein J3Q66DRAFT_367688 [Benniella sp.]|nr:MAG: hypothetical protein J3Q66DRAFT_367688 [Benniella sp.]
MEPQNRLLCCCCIPLSKGIILISLLMVLAALFNAWTFISPGVHGTISIISTAVSIVSYMILGVFGLTTAYKKTYKLARRFSIVWWTFTAISTLMMLVEIIILTTTDKEQIKDMCRELVVDEMKRWGYSEHYDQKLVDSCYSSATMFVLIVLTLHVILMTYFGTAIHHYAQMLNDRPAVDGLEHSVQIQLNDVEQSANTKN